MSYSYLLIVFISLGILAVASIFFGIINWVQLTTTSSAINKLQTEIDKKFNEKDSRSKGTPPSEGYTPPATSSAQPPTQPQVPMPQTQINVQQAPQIEIVRNVRGGYVVSEPANLTQETIPVTQKAPQPLNEMPENIYKPPQPVPEQAVYNNVQAQSQMQPPPESTQGEVLEVVDESKEKNAIQPGAPNSVTIPLYSKASQDADFNSLWKMLIQTLETSPNAHIQIDFKNILFLYDKEMEYLLKIYRTIELKKGKLSFIHCGPELILILNNEPQLKHLILKET